MNIPSIFWIVPAASVVALSFAWAFYRLMKREDEGTPRMREIAAHVRKGAMAYLRQQYKVVGIVFAVLALFFAWLAYGAGVQNGWVPFAFITGGFFSGLAGYFGMKTATYASARTANAARQSLDRGLKVAFRSGAVMGLVVVGLGLLDISAWYLVLNHFIDATGSQKLMIITTTMLTFGMGASTQALFARVGGGIYTKAADVGADLVGKVEAGIPEDDPRNPATIADNVGDNVGDVAGMGADLYESYCGSILATAALGAAAFAGDMQIQAVLAPMLIAAVGIVLSVIGIFLVRTKEGATMKNLLGALGTGVNTSSALIAVCTFGILYALQIENWVGISFSVIVGLVAGIIIGQSTEYYTSHSYKPTRKIAKSAETGPATVIISGIGMGMISTAIPVVTIAVAIVLAFLCATGFDIHNMISADNLSKGLYGIGIAAVGMLSTLGITLATDAYGPIADNAGGKQRCDDRQMEIGKPVGNAVKIVHAGARRRGDRENGVGISAERHKARLTERKESRETVAEVHGHRKQRIDRAELQNRAEHRRTRNKLAGADDDRCNAEKTDGGTDRFFLLTHAHTFSFSFSPNKPVGRTSSTRISTTNVKTSLNSE